MSTSPRVPGEVLWTLVLNHQQVRAELRDDRRVGAGVDFQIFHGDHLALSHRCASREEALLEATACRLCLEEDGYQPLAAPEA